MAEDVGEFDDVVGLVVEGLGEKVTEVMGEDFPRFDAGLFTEGFHLGVELTTLPKSQYDFALKHPSDPDRRDQWLRGYIPPVFKKNGIALSLSEEEINRCKVEYVVAGAHWSFGLHQSRKGAIKSYQDQQMFIAQQSYVDIIAHPWWIYMGRYVKKRHTDRPLV